MMLTAFICTLAASVLLVGTLPTGQGICSYYVNSPDASAKHSVLGSGSFFSYSCRPCVREDGEVHVLNMYQPYRTLNSTQPVPVTIEAAAPTDIKLMLISHEAVHWEITKPAHVTISHIALVSYYKDSAVDVNGWFSLRITREDNYITGWDSEEMVEFVTNRLGFLSSFTGVYETSTWTLTVGECEAKENYLTTPRMKIIKKETPAPKRHKVILSIPTEDEEIHSPKTGQTVIFIVAAVAIIGGLGAALYAAPKKKSNREYLLQFKQTLCFCLMRNEEEDPGQVIELPAVPLLETPSAPPLTWREQEPGRAPEMPAPPAPPDSAPPDSEPPSPSPSLHGVPGTPSVLAMAPPAYQDAVNYPRPETSPPTYNSV